MHPVLIKTFGGLSKAYYFRQFLFGLTFPVFILIMLNQGPNPVSFGMLLFMAVSTFLYPYSRFVYESVIDFITGDNVFFWNAFVMLLAKLITMSLCFFLAIFVAPVGLGYLYFHHSKKSA